MYAYEGQAHAYKLTCSALPEWDNAGISLSHIKWRENLLKAIVLSNLHYIPHPSNHDWTFQ